MKIIVEMHLLKHAVELIDDIYRGHSGKIEKAYRHKKEILFKNGDKLKVTTSYHIDGLRADVAIGPNAFALTCISKQSKRIWTYDDLENYLKNL